MARPNQSIDQRLLAAQLAINNSLNSPVIMAAIAPFAYDLARMEAASALYTECMDLVALQKQEYGEQYEATNALNTARETANLAYMNTRKISRIVFRNHKNAPTALGLGNKPKVSLGGWLEQATVFYNNMLRNADFVAAMGTFGYDQAKLEAEAALVQAVATANEVQKQERGEAQEATKLRDAKLDELDQWLADFKVVAEIALAGSPQQLEQLGWVVAS